MLLGITTKKLYVKTILHAWHCFTKPWIFVFAYNTSQSSVTLAINISTCVFAAAISNIIATTVNKQ